MTILGINCAVCGKPCKWVSADSNGMAPNKFGGWYCEPCDTYSETDVGVEE
jgi:hypothetical protein